MGCVVSSDDRRRIIGVSHHHHHHQQHIVSLTSSTYGILTAPRAYASFAHIQSAADIQSSPPPPPDPTPEPEVINSWELMAGLCVDPSSTTLQVQVPKKTAAEEAVLYTTSLRGVRATFEACNAVRAALQAHGVAFRERDVSMDRGFRDELHRELELLATLPSKKKQPPPPLVPRLFVRGRHVGGADEVLRLDEEGALAPLLEGLPKARGGTCDGCGGMRFLPCFQCSGSRKLVLNLPLPSKDRSRSSRRRGRPLLVVRCRDCNENGLVLCPICS